MYPLEETNDLGGFAAFNAPDTSPHSMGYAAEQQQHAQQAQHAQPAQQSPALVQAQAQAQMALQAQLQAQQSQLQQQKQQLFQVQQQQQQAQLQLQRQQPYPTPVSTTGVSTPVMVPYAVAAPQPAAAAAAQQVYEVPVEPRPPTFLDRMWARRRDIVKLVVLGMVVLFAVSSHWSISHYIKLYIEQLPYAKSVWVEAAVRAAYPAAILLIIWILKTPLSSSSS